MTQDLALRRDVELRKIVNVKKQTRCSATRGNALPRVNRKDFYFLRTCSSALQLLRRTNQISRSQFCAAPHRDIL